MKLILYPKRFTQHRFGAGFTLIELLIVITVVAVLGTAVVVAINPIAKINLANLAKVETFDASLQNNLSINLVGEWKLDDTTTIPGPPVKVKDTSGNGNDGTLNGPLGVNNLPQLTADRRGQSNKAYSFDGVDDSVSMTHTSIFDITDAKTVSLWIKNTGDTASGSQRLIFNSSNYEIYLLNNGTLYLRINSGGSPSATASISENEWHHVTGIVDIEGTDTVLTLYVDGQKKSSVVRMNETPGSSSYFRVGNTHTNSSPFNGSIDDVRIYSQAFSFSQVQQLYARGLKSHQLARQVNR
jgi:prepilin-type N-terminal cleavage/methylation domain-containing protein